METSVGIRVLIVMRELIQRIGLMHIITLDSEMQVVASVSTLDDARRVLIKKPVDLVIVNAEMEGGTGYSFIQELAARKPRVWPVAYDAFGKAMSISRALKSEAKAVITAEDSKESILTVLIAVTAGRQLLSPCSAEVITRELTDPTQTSEKKARLSLSARESQVYQLLGKGSANKDIAAEMGISVRTVDTLMDRIKDKLGVKGGHKLRQRAAMDVSAMG